MVVLFSPPTLVLAVLLQWMLRRRIPNPWVRVLGSRAVAGAVCNVAFFALLKLPLGLPGLSRPSLRLMPGSPAAAQVRHSVFYNQLASSRGDYASAFRHGIVSIAAFVAAALALVLADAFTRDS